MKRISLFSTLTVGLLIALTSLYGYSLLQQRADLPTGIRKALGKGQLAQIDDIKIEQKKGLF